MRKIYWLLIVAIQFGFSVHAKDSSDYWIGCWMTAVELSKNPKEHQEAIEAYTAAIKAQDASQIAKYPCLYNERGKLHLKMQNHQQAIQDFSFVLNQQGVNKEEVLDALWGRGQAYLASGKQGEFENDRKRLDDLERFIIPLEENPNYLILKLGNHVWRDEQSRERFVKVLLMQKKIKSKQDVVFTPSGIAIVKKIKSS